MKIDFQKIFKKEKKFKKPSFNIDINSHWKLLLYVSLVLIIFAFAFGFYFFVVINKDFTVSVVKTSSQMEKVKKDRVDSILNYFLVKSQKVESILSSASPVVDPSK
jgi:hypothetical protein